jgi:hypothetical protein
MRDCSSLFTCPVRFLNHDFLEHFVGFAFLLVEGGVVEVGLENSEGICANGLDIPAKWKNKQLKRNARIQRTY